LSEIKMGEGVEFVQLSHGNDAAVASVSKPRAIVEEVVAKPAEGAADAAAPAAEGAKAADATPADEAKSDKAK
jgi:large subunit ribosomal protein L25